MSAGARVCFMDLNAEVLAGVTRRNIALNCPQSSGGGEGAAGAAASRLLMVSGDWADASRLLRAEW